MWDYTHISPFKGLHKSNLGQVTFRALHTLSGMTDRQTDKQTDR